MAGRSLRKGIGVTNQSLVSAAVKTKGKLDRVTVMCVINAAGQEFKPVVVYPGKQPHYRRLGSSIQTVHQFLPPCYFYRRDPAGADSNSFNRALSFVKETEELRIGCQKLLLLFDGYDCHVQYKVLQYLKENGVVVALPAHTSHILQPIDVTVFCPFKSFYRVKFTSVL